MIIEVLKGGCKPSCKPAARKLLLARRLIEAGVRCVSVSFSDFDTHPHYLLDRREPIAEVV